MPLIFHHPTASTLYFPIETPVNVELYYDHPHQPPPRNGSRRIYVQCESTAIINCHEYLRRYAHLYDVILVFDPETLGLPNAYEKIEGGSWIPPEIYTKVDIAKKTFSISSVTGSKASAPGHHLRHVLYNAQKQFSRFPITFFRSGAGDPMHVIENNPMLASSGCSAASGPSKMPLFETFQYSIVIENNREKNYFTEKIIDCVVTKTIPIYWGSPNIGEYFDTTGWILLGDDIVKSLEDSLSQLDEGHYGRHVEVVNANYERAVKIADYKRTYTDAILPYVQPTKHEEARMKFILGVTRQGRLQ